jgi:hypothetical protein
MLGKKREFNRERIANRRYPSIDKSTINGYNRSGFRLFKGRFNEHIIKGSGIIPSAEFSHPFSLHIVHPWIEGGNLINPATKRPFTSKQFATFQRSVKIGFVPRCCKTPNTFEATLRKFPLSLFYYRNKAPSGIFHKLGNINGPKRVIKRNQNGPARQTRQKRNAKRVSFR